MSKFSNRRSHFRHLGPVLAEFESGSKGGNGGSPLRGINTADCCVELLAVWGLSGAWFPDHRAFLNYNVNPLFRYPYLVFSSLALTIF